MDSSRLLQVSCWMLLLVLYASLPAACLQSKLQVVLNNAPLSVSSDTTASFGFYFQDQNGKVPCGACTVLCKLDNKTVSACGPGALYTNVSDGRHAFEVFVNTSRGLQALKQYIWAVDTEAPTASIDAGPGFTSAANLTVDIRFSEACTGGRGFTCVTVSTCDLRATGAGVVLPSTLKTIQNGVEYSLVVALSTKSPTGRVTLALAKDFCTDAAGNRFQRSLNSTKIVHFDRRPVIVNLWTAIPDSRVQISNLSRTVQATNKFTDLKIYLDFTEPVMNSSEDLLNALKTSSGILEVTHRKSHGNRRFGFLLTNVSTVAVITVRLESNGIFGRAGTPVTPPSSVTFLYDSKRPIAILTTSSLAKTRDRNVAILIEFTKPVFSFGSSSVTILGGKMTSFAELSKSAYALNVFADEKKVVTIFVPENKTTDIAGNLNLPSNIVRVRHYAIPSVSVALYSFTTASLLATSFAAGVLSISSASLAAAGALTTRTMGSIVSDPSRNLLGMAGHLQVFALSEWLAVSLPIEYRETTRGLQWLIPHVRLPWETQKIQKSGTVSLLERDLQSFQFKKQSGTSISEHNGCTLLMRHCNKHTYFQEEVPISKDLMHSHSAALLGSSDGELSAVKKGEEGSFLVMDKPSSRMFGFDQQPMLSKQRRRRLGANATIFGPPLTASDYKFYFENQSSVLSAAGDFPESSRYTGWHDFGMNMFWLGAVGGALILLHLCTLGFLRWRTKTSLRGALSIPRFEFFLMIFALPGMCQALAFVIRGGTTGGIIVGVVLLAVPASFLLSVLLFLSVALFIGKLVQYKEIRLQQDRTTWNSRVLVAMIGANSIGKWTRKEGLSSSFIPRFGLLFEDRKGPPKLVVLDGNNRGSLPKWIDSGSNGIGRMRAVNSDDESEDAVVSKAEKIIGAGRAGYVIVDLTRRVTLGLVFGAYPRSDHSWSQVSIVFGFTVGQLLYLMMFKPYIRRGVQVVETISLLCEAAMFATGLALLIGDHPSDDREGVGIFMIVLLLISFVVQLVNEWYALMNQLLRLSPSQEPSLKLGLKMLYRGLLLPFVPRHRWPRFITPQPLHPKTGLVPVIQHSPEVDLEKTRATTSQSDPILATASEVVVPAYGPGSPCFIDPRTVSAVVVEGDGEGSASGEIRSESSQKQGQPWNQWSISRSMEGKRSRGTKIDPKSNELKMLRELAKASFPKGKKDEEPAELAGSLELASAMASPSSLLMEQQTPSRTGAIRGQGYSDDSSSDDDLEILSQRESPIQATAAATTSSVSLIKVTGQSAIQEISSSTDEGLAVAGTSHQ